MADERMHERAPEACPGLWRWALLLIPVGVLLCGGCAPRHALTLQSRDQSRVFTLAFPQAYASRGGQGDYEVVLIDPGADIGGDPARPLEPVAAPPLRPVVRVRTFWRPLRGSRADFPAAANASIDWYVFGVWGAGRVDMVRYEGVGFVRFSRAGDVLNLTIDEASLSPAARHGAIADPIGPARLRGAAQAHIAPARVRDALADLEQARRDAEGRGGEAAGVTRR